MKSTPASRKPTGRLELAVQYEASDPALPDRATIRRWVRAACPGPAQVTVRFVDAEEGRALNARYRGKDKPTNVLSFPYETAPRLAGDLVLCLPVVREEAAGQGKTLHAHLAHLVVHGMLHLAGHDHETHDDARVMEDRERGILAGLGYADPYLEDAGAA